VLADFLRFGCFIKSSCFFYQQPLKARAFNGLGYTTVFAKHAFVRAEMQTKFLPPKNP
jgi:hypothetical protein